MNMDPRLRVQSQHAAKSITCPGMHGSSFYINLVASTAAKNAVSARHPRGPSVGAERRSRAPRVPRFFRAERSVAASRICPGKHCTGAPMERAGRPKSAPYITRAAPYMEAVGA